VIYLVRHGETEWNVARRLQGRQESPLTPRGRGQAAAMADLLADLVAIEPPRELRLVSSPLGRARQTAEAIATRLDLPLELDDRLAEIAFGDWEGRLHDEVAPTHPEVLATREWLVSAPGGETFEEVWARAAAFLAEQPPETNRQVIAVSHGVTGRVIRGCYGGLSRRETLTQSVPHGAVWRLANSQIDRFDCEPAADA
jgi:broad specificity phosphatase PhoE